MNRWMSNFGNLYTKRNSKHPKKRMQFWAKLMSTYNIHTVLELGCNVGHNIKCIEKFVSHRNIWGMEINDSAIKIAKKNTNSNIFWGDIFHSFPIKSADLVFTCGVLIHLPPESLEAGEIFDKIYDASNKYILFIEYAWDVFKEIPYRGETRALWKGPYNKVFEDRMGDTVELIDTGFLDKSKGFDDCTYWMYRKTV